MKRAHLLVFVMFSALGALIVWWYFPETKGLTLEEMGRVFGDHRAESLGMAVFEGAIVEDSETDVKDLTSHHIAQI